MCQYIDMICINCFHEKTKIVNSRQHKKKPLTWRRHVCNKCGHTFTTHEQPTINDIKVFNKDNQTSNFNIGKLTISIAKSFQHNPHAADFYSYDLALTIQNKLLGHLENLSANLIATITHEVLQRFDQIAALQYAAQHNLITSQRHHRGRPSFSYTADVPDRSSEQ